MQCLQRFYLPVNFFCDVSLTVVTYCLRMQCYLLWNFSGSNTDGRFTTAVSNSFLSPLEKSYSCRFGIIKGVFFLFILKMVYCVYSLESPP